MLIIELLILLFAHLWPGIVFLLFIVKDIRLIEDKYWRAAGYQLDKLKKILVVLSLLVIPVILTVGRTIYVWTDILTDPDVLTNPDVLLWILSVPLCIISCAVAEAILLNRGEEKHRALPWGLAAVNAVSALLLAALLAALAFCGRDFVDWIYGYYYTPPYDPWKMIGLVPAIAMAIVILEAVLLAKQLFFALRFRTGAEYIPLHLIMIGADLLVTGLSLILPRAIRDPDRYIFICFLLLFLLNAGAVAAVIVLQVRGRHKVKMSAFAAQPPAAPLSEQSVSMDSIGTNIDIGGDMIVTTRK